MQTLKPFINGQFIDSVSTKYNKIFDPSTGEQIAQVPACTREELESAIQAAKAAGVERHPCAQARAADASPA